MGFFGKYLYNAAQWKPQEHDREVDAAEPWLVVDIHDSDFTTVTYRPAGPGSGVAYLGDTPRTYFEEESASAPTDVAREAAGLADWWAQLRGGAHEAALRAKELEIVAYLAEDTDPDDIEFDEDEDVDDLDDAEIFVEIKTGRFLAALDLPVPEDLLRD